MKTYLGNAGLVAKALNATVEGLAFVELRGGVIVTALSAD